MSPETPPYARLLMLGDVHAEAESVQRVLDHADAHLNVDASLCVGDIVDGVGDADATLEILRNRGVITVAGNHERWFLHDEMRHLANCTPTLRPENRTMLEGLPRTLRLPTLLGGAILCHAVGEDDEAFLRSTTRGYDLQIEALREAAASQALQGILDVRKEALVSSDILGDSHSSIVDVDACMGLGQLVKIVGWYDNEWGYSNRCVELLGKVL